MNDERKRASLGFGDELEAFDPSAWSSGSSEGRSRLPPSLTKQAGEATGFSSREAKLPATTQADPSLRQQRRRRTGRNVQFNIKTKPETIEAFVAIADAQGWGIGETFEIATGLLQKSFKDS